MRDRLLRLFSAHRRLRGPVPTAGGVGDCYDATESSWSRTQVEPLDRRRRRTRVELANAAVEYLETRHDRQRRHSGIGTLTPIGVRDHPTRGVRIRVRLSGKH